jgi:hypothetical protein
MSQGGIEPEKVTKPIQLTAAWFAALVLLVGAFLTASDRVDQPSWLPVVYALAAVAAVPLFAWLVFRLQTRYRPELQEDAYYSKYRAEQAQQKDFRPENLPPAGGRALVAETGNPDDLEQARREIYERQRGLFVVHTWRPSTRPEQVADITVRLHEHGEEWTPISDGEVRRVEYYLGRSFFGGRAVSKTDADDGFRLDVAAWGTTDCVARVHFTDGTTVDIDRYLDFTP